MEPKPPPSTNLPIWIGGSAPARLENPRARFEWSAANFTAVPQASAPGADVRAPRVIMHDGAIVDGGLDMSAALPSRSEANESKESFSKGRS